MIGTLFLLVFLSASVVPFFSVIYLERMAIREETRQLAFLEEEIHDYLTGRNQEDNVSDRFEIKHEYVKAGLIRKCLSWTGLNGRVYEHCLLAAK